ncbi:DUF3080 family protein [Pseudidiomarina insulisalsae]|nr:DUF3080 family protein [Pseudidiomarina insulisalsae]
MTHIVKVLRHLGYACCALLLLGCSDVPSALTPLHDYQTRVANTLEREPISYHRKSYPLLPQARELRIEVPRVSISLLDSWRVNKCAAGQLIAERNSALGTLERGVTRYVKDVQLSLAIEDCVRQLEANGDALAARLQEALEAKQETLAAERQHALGTDPALRNALRVGGSTLAVADDDLFAASISSLETIIAALQADLDQQPPTEDAVEQALEDLYQYDYLPQLWRSLHELNTYLHQLEPLTVNLASASGCTSKGRPERANVLHTIFLKYFIGEAQPHMAKFTQQGYIANDALEELYQLSEQPQMREYLRALMDLTDQLNAASKAHVEPWQEFFSACNFSLGDGVT